MSLLRSETNIRVLGTIDTAAEFYVVYSTSNVPYQDWQGELLEHTINSGADASRCQISRLVSNDSRAADSSFQLGSGVTFIFPSRADLLPDGTYFALLNKSRGFQSLTAWWMKHPDLDPDAVFVLVDPDMVW